MPEISRFYGIIIAMFAKDHVPPHFMLFMANSKQFLILNQVKLLKEVSREEL